MLLARAPMLRQWYGLHLGSFGTAKAQLFEEIVWPPFWARLWLIVLIFVSCALRELVRVVGRERVRHLVFGHPDAALTHGAGS